MKYFKKIKSIVEDYNTKSGKVFNIFILFLIFVSLISFSIDTLPNLNNKIRNFLYYLDLIIVIIFTIEYCLRIIVADKKLGYIFSIFGIVDIIAILPFYLTTGLDLRAFRSIRLFRVFRIFKLFRYSKAIERLRFAFKETKDEMVMFFLLTLFLLYMCAVGIHYFEKDVQPEEFASIFHSLWWAVATLTTVGYGDVYPITAGGKIFTFIMLMIGLGIVAVPAGLIASALTNTDKK